MKTEQEIKEKINWLSKILNDRRFRASQTISLDEIMTLKWVLGEYEEWHDTTFELYEKKIKV